MTFQSIVYGFPAAAYLLFVLPFIFWFFWSLYYYRLKLIKGIISDTFIDTILIKHQGGAYWVKVALICLAWLLGVLALMDPKGNGHYPQLAAPQQERQKNIIKRKAHDVIFLLDVSASMNVKDARSKISRFEYAKNIGDEILRKLTNENGSLHVFTSETMQLSPSTWDYLFLRLMLRQAQINEGETAGTNIGKALTSIQKQYYPQPTPRLKTLILLTDGDDTSLEGLTGSAREKAIETITDAISNAEANHLRVYVVGIGSRDGKEIPGISYKGKPVISALQEDLLRKISEKGRGRYYDGNDYSPIQIADDILAKRAMDTPFFEDEIKPRGDEESFLIYDHYFQFPLGIAILCLILTMVIPDTNFMKRQT